MSRQKSRVLIINCPTVSTTNCWRHRFLLEISQVMIMSFCNLNVPQLWSDQDNLLSSLTQEEWAVNICSCSSGEIVEISSLGPTIGLLRGELRWVCSGQWRIVSAPACGVPSHCGPNIDKWDTWDPTLTTNFSDKWTKLPTWWWSFILKEQSVWHTFEELIKILSSCLRV